MFNKKDLKSNITSCNGRINTNFHNGEMPKEGSHNICLSVILIASVFKMHKNFPSKVFLENLWISNANTLSKKKR